uniref:Uncharacterized protein n=1 Tax=Anopheles atroparvus TaxID=41427 RepID=A0A182JD46_ANOAO
MSLFLVLALAVPYVLPLTVHGMLRMYGARDASITQYPFMAIVAHDRFLVGNGAIVAPRWVLTAASTLLNPGDIGYSAVIGGDNLSTGSRYDADHVYKHPEWVGNEYNIALLHLSRSIHYGLNVQPIGIVISNPATIAVTILSFGENEQGSSHLQESEYILTSDKSCTDRLREALTKETITNGRGYCVVSPPGTEHLFSWNDVGSPVIANNELVALFSSASLDDVPYNFVATRVVLALAVACVLPSTVHGELRMYEANEASITQYPFMAIVAHSRQLVGNGVIIAPQWVLTSSSALLHPYESEYCAVIGGNTLSTGKWYDLKRVYKHPEWIGYEYNVALLHLRKKIQYGANAQPIPVAYSNPPRIDVKVLSFGRNEQGATRLQESDYILASDQSCVNSLVERFSKVTVVNGHGYCIWSPPGTNKLFWENDVGAPAIANNEPRKLAKAKAMELSTQYLFKGTLALEQHRISAASFTEFTQARSRGRKRASELTGKSGKAQKKSECSGWQPGQLSIPGGS